MYINYVSFLHWATVAGPLVRKVTGLLYCSSGVVAEELWNFRSHVRSLPGTFAPWNFRSLELSSPGTFAPESENDVELSLPNMNYQWFIQTLGLRQSSPQYIDK